MLARQAVTQRIVAITEETIRPERSPPAFGWDAEELGRHIGE